jgi:hypothetical protein
MEDLLTTSHIGKIRIKSGIETFLFFFRTIPITIFNMVETLTKPVHREYALKNGKIGTVNRWGFNNSYIFLNFEDNKMEYLKSLGEVELLGQEKGSEIFRERNTKFTDKDGREREKLLAAVFNLRGTTEKSGKWMKDFCNEIGAVYGTVIIFEKLVAMYNDKSLRRLTKKPAYKSIAYKYIIKNDFSEKAFSEELTEDEILKIIGKYKHLPRAWRNISIRKASKELKHYMKVANEIEFKVEVTPDSIKEKSVEAEKNLIKNVEAKSLKLENHGHAPYGSTYRVIKEKIEDRERLGKSEDVMLSRQLIGSDIYKDGTGCYYCGNSLGIHINDENSADIFMWKRGEDYDDKIHIPGECEMRQKENRINEFELKFPTGEVVIDNYFNKDRDYLFDVPEKEQYSDKYSLETLKGRFNRQNYLAETYNMGYGQMGNMSMEVFVSKDGKEIIFGDEPNDWYDEDEDGNGKPTKEDKKFNKEFEKNYTCIGKVSLGVWRWECADKKTLTDAGHSGEGEVLAKVQPGAYSVKHFYGCVPTEDNTNRYMIYTKISLKEE